MTITNFKERERKKKKNIVSDNQPKNNQHALSLKEEDTIENPMTWLKKVFHYWVSCMYHPKTAEQLMH